MVKFARIILLFGLCLFAFTVQAADTVRIGLITPLTGGLSFGGNEVKNGVTLAVEAKKTIFGKPIELIVGNTPDATAGVAEMERLITREKLKVIISGYGSSIEKAYQKVAERYKVLCLGTVNWAESLTQNGLQYYYRFSPHTGIFGKEIGKLAPLLGTKYLGKKESDLKIVVVNSDLTGYVTEPILKQLKASSIKKIYHESYPSDLKDFASLILKVKKHKPDIVIAAQYTADGLAFRKQMYAMNYEPPIMLGAGLIYDQPEFATLGEKAADGALAISFTNPEMNPNIAPGLLDFKETYTKRFGHAPLTHALQAYTATLIYLDAIERAGSIDVEKIREALAKTDVAPGKTPSYWGCKFDPQTHQNERAGKPLVLAQWKKGKYVVVWPEEFAVGKLELPLKPFSKR